jgi:hypothetical protein
MKISFIALLVAFFSSSAFAEKYSCGEIHNSIYKTFELTQKVQTSSFGAGEFQISVFLKTNGKGEQLLSIAAANETQIVQVSGPANAPLSLTLGGNGSAAGAINLNVLCIPIK